MIFGFGKSRKKEVQPDAAGGLVPAYVCSHVLESMKGAVFVGLVVSRDDENSLSAVCSDCNDPQANADSVSWGMVTEGQLMSYAGANGVKI